MRQRKVTRIVRGRNAVDGAGVRLRRILGDRTIQDFDPFLMLDGFDSIQSSGLYKGISLASASWNRDRNLFSQRNNGA